MIKNNAKKSFDLEKGENNCRLEMVKISTFYGEAQALRDISIVVNSKEIVAIFGSNGAGKTTLLQTLVGMLKPKQGKIVFCGESIEGLDTYQIIRRGISIVPDGRELFGTMSVLDNLLLGSYPLRREKRKEIFLRRLDMIFTLFPILKRKLKQQANTLSGGEQQMLTIGRGLMANPKLLCLDEPSLGLSPLLVIEMMRLLKIISNEWGISLLLVEQNIRASLKIVDYVYILERGETVLKGTSKEVTTSPIIQKAYLGG
jgi:branched-chain amino acid transport system ATP-binding protein